MCNLCDDDSSFERDRLRAFAAELEAHAALMRGLANGIIKPHSDECAAGKRNAEIIIKKLVNEWF